MLSRKVDNDVRPLRFIHESMIELQAKKGEVWNIVGSTSGELAGMLCDETHSMN